MFRHTCTNCVVLVHVDVRAHGKRLGSRKRRRGDAKGSGMVNSSEEGESREAHVDSNRWGKGSDLGLCRIMISSC